MFSQHLWFVVIFCFLEVFQLSELDSLVNKLNIAERKVSLRHYYAPSASSQLHQMHVSKRLFNKNKKSKMGRSSSFGKAKNVLTKVGGALKGAAIKAKDVIMKCFGKVKGTFQKIKEKLTKAFRRTRDVFKKCKGVKYVLFIKNSAQAVWTHMPEAVKDMVYDKMVDMAIGDLDDLEELSLEDFDPNELGDDDDIAELLGEDYDALAKELGFDYDLQMEEEVEDLDEVDKKVMQKGSSGKQIAAVEIKAKQQVSSCCCVNVEGKETESDNVSNEELEEATVTEEGDDTGLDVELDDFSASSLDEEDLDLSDFDDIDYDDIDLDDLEFKKRSITVAKRSSCNCAASSVARREYVRGRQIKKTKNKNSLPALTSALPGYLIEEFLKSAKILTEKPICKDGSTTNCLDLSVVRFGALAALLSTKVLCPICEMVLINFDKNKENPFKSAWNFYLKGTEDLSVFLSEAFKSYDGQTDFFDGHNNRWSIVKTEGDNFIWQFRTHL